ncbi:MAG: hypothetical protein HQK59_00175, partial [Deltaproteobacteria bacterium]|nr:hypothetical protein [Deltaproteobacteria bacterium]
RECFRDSLNKKEQFFPFLAQGTKGAVLVNRKNIVRVSLSQSERTMSEEISRQEKVSITLYDGVSMEGVVCVNMPSECGRLSDFLNQIDQFMYLSCEDDDWLINTDFIRFVRSL